MDNGRIRWYNIDLPETIEVRDSIYHESGRVSTIGCSAFDPAWAAGVEKQGKILFIIEGLTMYLTHDQVKDMLGIIKDHFENAYVCMECLCPKFVGKENDMFRTGTSQYTWQGKDIPFAHYAQLDKKSLFSVVMGCLKDKNYDFKHIMRYSYDKSELTEEARIKVENMNADIIMLGAKKDDCWPSDIAVPRMEKLLREKHYPHKVKAIVYPKASHALFVLPESMREFSKKFKSMLAAEKRYPEECERARQDATREMILFFEEWCLEQVAGLHQ